MFIHYYLHFESVSFFNMNIGYNTPLTKSASRSDAKFGRKSSPFFALQAVGLQPTKESCIPMGMPVERISLFLRAIHS